MLHKILLIVLIVLFFAEELALEYAKKEEVNKVKEEKTVDIILNELPSPVIVISTSSKNSTLSDFVGGEGISVKVKDGSGVITTLRGPSLDTVVKGDTLK